MSALLKTATLGCKVNQYETEYVREGLLRAGFQDAQDGEPADLCVVNTCTVTHEGDSKSRQLIRRLARENPHARIVVMGCYATRAPSEVAALPGVAEVVTDKRELPDLLGRFGVVDIPSGISSFRGRHRAYVKVQDGCLLRCSYCIIPKVRPQLTSRPLEHIADEVQRLIDNGFREIVLTGVHLGHYGVDWNWHRPKCEWTRLADLLRRSGAAARRVSIAVVEHRSHGDDPRTDRRDGRVRRQGLPPFTYLLAERIGRRPAPYAASLGRPAFSRLLSVRQGIS